MNFSIPGNDEDNDSSMGSEFSVESDVECNHCYDDRGLCQYCDDCEHREENIEEGKCLVCGYPIADSTVVMKEVYTTNNPKPSKNTENNNIKLGKSIRAIDMTEELISKISDITVDGGNMRYSAPQMDTIVLAYIYSAVLELNLDISPQRIIIQCKFPRGVDPKLTDEKKIKDVIKLFISGKIKGRTHSITKPSLYIREFYAKGNFPILGEELDDNCNKPPAGLMKLVERYDNILNIKPQRIAAALIMKYQYSEIKTPPHELIEYFSMKVAAITKTIAELGLTKTKFLPGDLN